MPLLEVLPNNGSCTKTTKSQSCVTAPPPKKQNKYSNFFDKPGAGAVMMQPRIPFSRSAQWSSSLDRATQLKSSLSASSAQDEARKRKLSWRRGSFPAEAVWPNKQTNFGGFLKFIGFHPYWGIWWLRLSSCLTCSLSLNLPTSNSKQNIFWKTRARISRRRSRLKAWSFLLTPKRKL